MSRDEQIVAILDEFPAEELVVLYGHMRVRMGWGGTALVRGTGGTIGTLDMTFDLERFPDDLQQRIRHAGDRLAPLLQD